MNDAVGVPHAVGVAQPVGVLSGQRPGSYQPRATPWVHRATVILLQANGLPHKVLIGSRGSTQTNVLYATNRVDGSGGGNTKRFQR